MSSQVIVNPDELERFARDLKGFNVNLRQMTSRLHGQFRQLGDTWQDQEHRKFDSFFKSLRRG